MLEEILKTLPGQSHPDLLVGMETADDVGVFRLTPEIALIQTLDFFTPIVNDPFTFGQIAAGFDIVPAAILAARVNRMAGYLAHPTPATNLREIVNQIPAALELVLKEHHGKGK